MPTNSATPDSDPHTPGGALPLSATPLVVKRSSDQLTLATTLANRGDQDLYLLDVLNTANLSGQIIRDPERVYRFVVGDRLRLLLGPAPLPRLFSVAVRYLPLATRLRAGESNRCELSIPLPVTEYNVYFGAVDPEQCERREVGHVELVVHYVVSGSDFEPTASPFVPDALALEDQLVDTAARPLRVIAASSALPVLRRRDEFERLVFAGETDS